MKPRTRLPGLARRKNFCTTAFRSRGRWTCAAPDTTAASRRSPGGAQLQPSRHRLRRQHQRGRDFGGLRISLDGASGNASRHRHPRKFDSFSSSHPPVIRASCASIGGGIAPVSRGVCTKGQARITLRPRRKRAGDAELKGTFVAVPRPVKASVAFRRDNFFYRLSPKPPLLA